MRLVQWCTGLFCISSFHCLILANALRSSVTNGPQVHSCEIIVKIALTFPKKNGYTFITDMKVLPLRVYDMVFRHGLA